VKIPLRSFWYLRAICLFLAFHLASSDLFASTSRYRTIIFDGAVAGGKTFEHKFGNMVFVIEPQDTGFSMSIWNGSLKRNDAHNDLSWITFPTHGLTDRDVLASDFRNKNNSPLRNGPRAHLDRRIYFSKNAAVMLDHAESARGTNNQYEDVRLDEGICDFHITHMEFEKLKNDHEPKIKSMSFRVKLHYLP
jgi:hypothetical protein